MDKYLKPFPSVCLGEFDLEYMFLDVETCSEVDLPTVGAKVYSKHPSTKLICIAFKLGKTKTQIFFPEDGDPFPKEICQHIAAGGKLMAWNSNFEKAIFDNVISKTCDCPAPSTEQWRCAQAVSLTSGYPAKMEEAATALGLPQQKLEIGKDLIKTYSIPGHRKEWLPGDKQAMGEYCKADVEVMCKALVHFRPLTEHEWYEFTVTQRLNDRGIPIDLPFAEEAWSYSQDLAESANEKISTLTDGLVPNATVRKARDEFLKPLLSDAHQTLISKYSAGKAKLSFDKDNRASLLLRGDLDPKVRRYLELVDEAGSSALTKYHTMIETESAGCAHGALRFNGASTGRYTSQGLQIHNMSRDCLSPVVAEQLVSNVTKGFEIDNAGLILAQLTRAAIYHPDGLYWVDLSGIESRVEPWLADGPDGDRLLEVHRQGVDIYAVTAAGMFNISLDEVTSEQRSAGKVAVLACGYGGGVDALQKMAKKFGLVFSNVQARSIVDAWRRSNPWAVRLWDDLEKAVRHAVREPEESFWGGRCEWYSDGGSFLWCRLPSGRLLAYPKPKWERHSWNGETRYGPSYQTSERQRKGQPPVRRQLHRGILSNNVTQGVAADLLREAILKAEAVGLDIRFTVHDECVGVGSETDGERLNKIMLEVPGWAEGLPLATSGVSYAKRWGK
jgi:DNA polymerase